MDLVLLFLLACFVLGKLMELFGWLLIRSSEKASQRRLSRTA
jgi:hypothetical protein